MFIIIKWGWYRVYYQLGVVRVFIWGRGYLSECMFAEKNGVVRMFIINLGLLECLFRKGVHACYKIGVVRMCIGKLGFVRVFSFKWGYVQCVIKL